MWLSFSIVMLTGMLMASFRSPRVGIVRVVWFVISLLPSELPWAFGLFQLVVTLGALLFADFSTAANQFALLLSLGTLYGWLRLHRKTFRAGELFRLALHQTLTDMDAPGNSANTRVTAPPVIQHRDWLTPFSYHRSGVQHLRDIAYGAHPRQHLDMYRSQEQKTGRPILLHVHGGGWILGHKDQQAKPLLNYLAQHGWLCVDINYRLAPHHLYPHCLDDVNLAIAWLKQHAEEYGGDPQFIAMVGESAGAHLCTLAALTANDPAYQVRLDNTDVIDTQVQAVIALYGVYDLTENSHTWSGMVGKFLQKKIMPVTPDILRIASPRHQIIDDAPPILVVHGTTDSLVFVEDARDFVGELRKTSRAPVCYVELDGAQHGFDLFHGVRAEFTIEAIGKFLRDCYNQHTLQSARAVGLSPVDSTQREAIAEENLSMAEE